MKKLFTAALCLTLLLTGCMGGPVHSAPAQPQVSPPPPASSQPLPVQPEPEPEPAPQPPSLEELAARRVAELTEEELVGQLFFVRYPGDADLAARWAEEYHLGGYILFGRDFKGETPDTLRAKLAASQQVSAIPMLMGVDEEGGSVVRASYYPAFRGEKFQSPQALYRRGGLEEIAADAGEKSDFLLDLGLNVNLAPVCDVSTDPADFIYDRAFGQDAQATAEYAALVVTAMGERGMGSVLKHFPGYGNNVDTHTGIALDQRPLEVFLENDLLPFRAGAQAGAGAVLVSHNIVTCLDEDLPASLSPAAYRLLREEVGFDGVAMTDDLDMGAVAQYAAEGSPCVMALSAGCDMVLTSDPARQIPQVLEGLRTGALSRARLEEAACRVLLWKAELGLVLF